MAVCVVWDAAEFGNVHIAPAKYKNADLFLRVGLQSPLICQKRSFSKTLFKPGEFENVGFSMGGWRVFDAISE